MSDWRQRALCNAYEAELWFPRANDMASTAEAKRVCDRCPVRSQCLEDALDKGWDVGIFGGLTAEERAEHRGAA